MWFLFNFNLNAKEQLLSEISESLHIYSANARENWSLVKWIPLSQICEACHSETKLSTLRPLTGSSTKSCHLV